MRRGSRFKPCALRAGAVIAIEVSNLDAFLCKMKERAVSFVTEAFDTPVCRVVVIENQGHNHITIHKRRT